MKRRVLILVLSVLALSAQATDNDSGTEQKNDSAVYQGTMLKIDIFNTEAEAAVNVRLMDMFYPTIEGGVLTGREQADSAMYAGSGGFGRIGLDFNPLKKSRKKPHAFLVGIRIGTAYQDFEISEAAGRAYRWDTWGEVAAGCQVRMISGFYMGWTARLKVLFTLNQKQATAVPYYIPGFGVTDTMSWGIDYYLCWRF